MPRSPRLPLLAALLAFLAFCATGLLAYLVPFARVRDSATLQGFTQLNRPEVTPLLDRFASLADPVPYALIGLALVLLAAARRRPRTAAAIAGLIVVTAATSQTLKPLLASPRYDEWLGGGQISAASWPSGHATAAMTLALCAILAVPQRLRPTAAVLGLGFALAVSYSILALGWHFPSDVLGGFLVAATWTLLAVAALSALEQRWPSRRHAVPHPRVADAAVPLGLGALALSAATLVALARPRTSRASHSITRRSCSGRLRSRCWRSSSSSCSPGRRLAALRTRRRPTRRRRRARPPC